MTRTDAVLAAVCAELEPWRRVIDTMPGLRSVSLVAMLTPEGQVRTVLVRPESEWVRAKAEHPSR